MPEENKVPTYRLNKITKEFGVSVPTIVEFLAKKGHEIKNSPNEKLNEEQYQLVCKEFSKDKETKKSAEKLANMTYKGGTASIETVKTAHTHDKEEEPDIIVRTNILSDTQKKTETEEGGQCLLREGCL